MPDEDEFAELLDYILREGVDLKYDMDELGLLKAQQRARQILSGASRHDRRKAWRHLGKRVKTSEPYNAECLVRLVVMPCADVCPEGIFKELARAVARFASRDYPPAARTQGKALVVFRTALDKNAVARIADRWASHEDEDYRVASAVALGELYVDMLVPSETWRLLKHLARDHSPAVSRAAEDSMRRIAPVEQAWDAV